jgi:hypothetical protein
MLSHLSLTGSHLTTATTPDCHPGRVLHLSLEVTLSLERGTDVDDRDRPRDPRVPPVRPTSLQAPLPLPVDPFAGHNGFDPSRSLGPPQPVTQPPAQLEPPAAPQADPAQNPIAYVAALMEDFSERMS